ncbi:hypothetical protein DVH26_30165 [Paenibacillus sp. H1-7]|uniref:hypothetical protein n=1 Tax=Paenibacillus sp. H1-7 TaxID=2282849 RepID=UPI001EF8AF0F|nr:hypothetical protein [Paenibacillus sp. H1-7]ULL18357.1 hypothetical protein DVH26_30165 [Paenibacillus sp. H1-7]
MDDDQRRQDRRAESVERAADDAVSRYLEKKRRAEQAANKAFERHIEKKEEALQRADDVVQRVVEARRGAYEHMERQADRIFEQREAEAMAREQRMEQLIARVREAELRLKEEIEQRASLTLDTVQLAKRLTLERIEREAEQAAARYIEAKKSSGGKETAWIDEAMDRLEQKRQQAKAEADRIAGEMAARVRQLERLTQLDVRDRSAFLQGRAGGTLNDADIAQYEPGIIERFGTFLSEILGSLIRVPFEIVEALTGSEMIGRIGMAVGGSVERSGITTAKAVQGAVDVVHGIVADDNEKMKQGAHNLKDAGSRVIRGAANTIEYTARSVRDVVSGDSSRMGRGVEGLLTAAAVMAIPAGLALDLGGLDIEFGGDDSSEVGMHHVNPHEVGGYTRADGTEVGPYHRGGDDGYDRTNPDGNPDNNLS